MAVNRIAWGLTLVLASSGAFAACASQAGTEGDYRSVQSGSGGGAGQGGAGGARPSSGVTSAASTTGSTTGSGGAATTGNGGGTTATSTAATTGNGATTTGSGGAAGSGGAGGAGGAPPVSWQRYSYTYTGNGVGAWSKQALSTVWTSASAPPATGILATLHLDRFDKLLVFASDGWLYEEEVLDSGNWKKVGLTQDLFPQMNGAPLHTAFHVPDDWNGTQMPPPPVLNEQLVFVDNPAAYLYEYHQDDSVLFTEMVNAGNAMDAGGPDQQGGVALWAFSIWNKNAIGQADGYDVWVAYDDGKVYELKADATWWGYPVAAGPLWSGVAGAPAWAGVHASYYVADPGYDGLGTVVFIGP